MFNALATARRKGWLRKLSGTIANVLRGDGTFGALQGTTTNDSAAAGGVGEFVSSTIALANKVALATDTAKTVTSVSLTAGDWDVEGLVCFSGNAATVVQYVIGAIFTTTDTMPNADQQASISYGSTGVAIYAAQDTCTTPPRTRISVAVTTTVYLVAKSGFTTNSAGAYGTINARRFR